jgi:hypothetical protein
MITLEYSEKDACVTIMDNSGKQEDLQMLFDWEGDTLFLRQWNDKNEGHEVITLSKQQAGGLYLIIKQMVEEE